MRARWIFHDLEPELPGVGMATVASWRPGTYWLVSTVQLDESSVKNYKSSERYPSVEFIQPIATTTYQLYPSLVPQDAWRLSRTARELLCGPNEEQIYRAKVMVPIGKAVPSPGKFVTQIYRCNKYRVRSFDGMMDWLYASTRLKGETTGSIPSFGDLPLFEREYFNLSAARLGHVQTVDLLASGRLVIKSSHT